MDSKTVQRSALCRSRRELSNEYLLAKIGVDTAENEPLEVWGENSIQYSLHSLPRGHLRYEHGWVDTVPTDESERAAPRARVEGTRHWLSSHPQDGVRRRCPAGSRRLDWLGSRVIYKFVHGARELS